MTIELMENLKWRMAKWLWTAPQDMPITDPEYTEWIKPEGRPVKHKTWRADRNSRGAKSAVPKHIDEFYHRGAYERHEARDRGAHKAVLPYRGKGTKTGGKNKKRGR